MGQYQRGVHFGAASLKRGEESSKFPVAIFCPPFSYTIFKQLFNISAAQNIPGPQAKTLAGGNFSNLFIFACTSTLNPSH